MSRPTLLLIPLLALLGCRDESAVIPMDPDDDSDGFAASEDCDDANDQIHPDALEVCDGVDNNCDGTADNGATDATRFYADADGDGYGTEAVWQDSCEQPQGYVESIGDCNDSDPAFHPSATEEDCTDANDYNCDGSVGHEDADADGFPACQDCNDADDAINLNGTEICDDVDNDCDGNVDEEGALGADTWYADNDGDGYGDVSNLVEACEQPSGYAANPNDCNDAQAAAHPGGIEICDYVDNDCDGNVDGDATDAATWYVDGDNDGYGSRSVSTTACDQPAGFVANDNDCDDGSALALPGGTEVCDDLDNDCDGTVDAGASDAATWYQDADSDSYGNPAVSQVTCDQPFGHVANAQDCDDTNAQVSPLGTELCDGADNNCDGTVDEDTAADAPTWFEDADGDSYGNPSASTRACAQPSGYTSDDADCDDTNAAIHPGTPWYLDYDGDGYGGSSFTVQQCTQPSGFEIASDDCDDSDPAYHPGATPGCDGGDYDCDGLVDSDADGDGYADGSCGGLDCDDSDATVVPESGGGCALGTSCADIMQRGLSTGDGTYTIDPDGFNVGNAPLDVICDMGTDGGGWTLIATNAWTGGWSQSGCDAATPTCAVLTATTLGSMSTSLDYKSEAWSTVALTDLLFENGVAFAQYDSVHNGSSAYHAWSNAILADGSISYGINCGPGTAYEFPMTGGDLADVQLCNTNLYMHVADHDGSTSNCSNDNEAWGPAWSSNSNNGCPLDDPDGSSFVGYRSSQHPWGNTDPLRMWVR